MSIVNRLFIQARHTIFVVDALFVTYSLNHCWYVFHSVLYVSREWASRQWYPGSHGLSPGLSQRRLKSTCESWKSAAPAGFGVV